MIKKSTMLFLACLCGLSIANIYYNRTLFVLIANTFTISVPAASYIGVVIQVAYAFGIVFFGPLGDIVNRRNLIVCLLAINAISQILGATSVSFLILLFSSIVIGLTAISSQVIVPGITLISKKEERGKNIAILMSGVFTGIVISGFISGFIGHYSSWRAVYWFSAIIDIILILITLAIFPKIPQGDKVSYHKLIISLGEIFISQPLLRKTCLQGALIFAAFSGVWGSLANLLYKPPYYYNSSIVGLFSLIGFFGIISANIIGRLSDKIGAKTLFGFIPWIAILAFAVLFFTPYSIVFCVFGMIILDMASRGSLITNQLINYTLDEKIRGRVNTIFMSCYFIGGAIGTNICASLSNHLGWSGLVVFGIVCSMLAFVANKLL